MSFLSKLSALKKNTPVKYASLIPDKEKTLPQEIESLLPENYVRDEDPAVKRLKELRRKEQIKNGELLKKRKATAKRQASDSSKSRRNKRNKSQKDEDGGMLGTVYKKKIGSSTRTRSNIGDDSNRVMKPRVPLKKMSFEELMRQAEQNDKLPLKSTSEPPVIGQSKKLIKPGFKSKSSRVNSVNTHESIRKDRNKLNDKGFGSREKLEPLNRSKSSSNIEKSGSSSSSKNIVKIPSISVNRFAQPNAKIKQRLERKGYKIQSRRDRFGRQYNKSNNDNYEDDEEEEVDSELDDFIEDDLGEEETRYSSRSEDPGYNRDEIWAMFNRGRSRSRYYNDYDDDDDADDMEANEMEILDEEEYATRMAKLEDKKEEEWLRRHEEEKKRLKKKRK